MQPHGCAHMPPLPLAASLLPLPLSPPPGAEGMGPGEAGAVTTLITPHISFG